jgi:hypothetical protein
VVKYFLSWLVGHAFPFRVLLYLFRAAPDPIPYNCLYPRLLALLVASLLLLAASAYPALQLLSVSGLNERDPLLVILLELRLFR